MEKKRAEKISTGQPLTRKFSEFQSRAWFIMENNRCDYFGKMAVDVT